MTSLYQQHVQNWSRCKLCDLCEKRNRVVLARGSIPCDVLFIGEAPGPSENIIGKPFVGPAGKLLDHIIERGVKEGITYAITNLVGCIPLDDDGDKFSEPEEYSIKACSPRLKEMVEICNPKLVVCVGALAGRWIRRMAVYLELGDTKLVDIIHPAGILRANLASRGIAIQRAIVTLANAVEEVS